MLQCTHMLMVNNNGNSNREGRKVEMSLDNHIINGLRQTGMNGVKPNNSSIAIENGKVIDHVKECETTEDILRYIMNKTFDISERLSKLEALEAKHAKSDSTFDSVLYTSFLSFCGSIISIYCDPTPNDKDELRMLIPLMSFVSTYGNADNKFSRYNDFILLTMMACVKCASSLLSQHKEFYKHTTKRNLTARARRVRNECSSTVLANMLGIPHFPKNELWTAKASEVSFETFSLCLYSIATDQRLRDINRFISKKNIQNSRIHNAVLGENNNCDLTKWYKRVKERQEEWTDVVIAYTFPFELVICCLKNNWQNELSAINDELMDYLPIMSDTTYAESMQSLDYEVGSIVGVWTTDATFKRRPIIRPHCLRGLVLGKASIDFKGVKNMSWALWAIDIGTVMFSSKIWNIPTHLANTQPIASVCTLHIEKFGKEEHQLLLILLRLLIRFLGINPEVAHHLFEPESETFEIIWGNFPDDEIICKGSAFLNLIEHPDKQVRSLFLEILLLITRSSERVLSYLKRSCFYLVLCNRLEMCVYFCNSSRADDMFWSDIKTSLLLLKSIFSGYYWNMTGFYGRSYIEKVLKMYTLLDHDEEKLLAFDCLSAFRNNNASMVLESSRVFMKEKEVEKEAAGGSLMTGEDESVEGGQTQENKSHLPQIDAIRKFDFYIKGNKFEIENDETHVIITQRSLYGILDRSIAKSICALMNGIGGSIYFGIDAENCIQGVRLRSRERKFFHNDVGQLAFNWIYPTLKPDSYRLMYSPVLNSGDKLRLDTYHLDWVIELQIKPVLRTVYSMVSSGTSYVRQGRRDHKALCLIVRQQAAEKYQREFKRVVEDISKQLFDTKCKLLSAIEDFKEEKDGVSS